MPHGTYSNDHIGNCRRDIDFDCGYSTLELSLLLSSLGRDSVRGSLGFSPMFGVTVNSVSYITLTVSIGLMVDFLIHILLRYFESTELTSKAKVKDTLKTMGVSVAMGGFTTLLGVLPLAFNTTGIFEVVFITFIGLVVFGVSHGLILLPVLLSMFGPEDEDVVLLSKGDRDDTKKDEGGPSGGVEKLTTANPDMSSQVDAEKDMREVDV